MSETIEQQARRVIGKGWMWWWVTENGFLRRLPDYCAGPGAYMSPAQAVASGRSDEVCAILTRIERGETG